MTNTPEDHEKKIAVVNRCRDSYAKAELGLQNVAEAMRELIEAYKDGAQLGMASSAFVAKEMALFNRIIGDVGKIEGKVYPAHSRGTAKAKANNADGDLSDGFVTILGSGR